MRELVWDKYEKPNVSSPSQSGAIPKSFSRQDGVILFYTNVLRQGQV